MKKTYVIPQTEDVKAGTLMADFLGIATQSGSSEPQTVSGAVGSAPDRGIKYL